MTRLILPLAVLLTACSTVGQTEAPLDDRELVVLVHGMGRTPLSMAPLALSLRRAGYRTLNVGYSSQGPGIETLAQGVAAAVHAETARAPAPRVHFVAHSLGGVLSRWVLANDPPTASSGGAPGRVVLLASPVAGSASADAWARWLRFSLPPISQLRTDDPFDPGALPPGTEVAVIAGDADGKVSADEACLPGAATRVIPSGHTAIMWRPRTARLVKAFLADGDLPGSFACDAASIAE